MESFEFEIKELGYDVMYLKRENKEIIFRVNIKTEEDFENYRNALCEKLDFCFNVTRTFPRAERLQYHKIFSCIFGDQRHKGVKKIFTGCKVRMDVKIKLVTKFTVRKDRILSTHPCFIKITGSHNHSVESANVLRHLRLLPKIKEEFYKYFDTGMSAVQAMRFHQEKIDCNLSALANSAKNPSLRAVQYLREMWLRKNHGNVGGKEIRNDAETNPNVELLHETDDMDSNISLQTFFAELVKGTLASEVVQGPVCPIEDVNDSSATSNSQVNIDSDSDENAFVDSPKNIEDPLCITGTTKKPGTSAKGLCDAIFQAVEQYGDDNTPEIIEKLQRKIKSVKSALQLNALLSSICIDSATAMLSSAGLGKLPCQPTSVAQRQTGMLRELAPLGKGRKRKGVFIPRKVKRPQNLALGVSPKSDKCQ